MFNKYLCLDARLRGQIKLLMEKAGAKYKDRLFIDVKVDREVVL